MRDDEIGLLFILKEYEDVIIFLSWSCACIGSFSKNVMMKYMCIVLDF
jgi:hypothetical protein